MYSNGNGCSCRSFRDTKNKVSPLTELKKRSEYVFFDHQTNIYNQYYHVLKKCLITLRWKDIWLSINLGVLFIIISSATCVCALGINR